MGLRQTYPELTVVPPSRAREIVTITLTATHVAPDRNQYGPGEVRVTRRIAAWLREREEIEPLMLRRRHTINGTIYGPGVVRVPRYLAEHFRANDIPSA